MSRIYLDDNLASPGDVGGVMQKAVLSPPPPPPHPGDQDTKDDNQWSPSKPQVRRVQVQAGTVHHALDYLQVRH